MRASAHPNALRVQAALGPSFTVVEADAVSKKFNLPGLQYNKAADEQSWSDMQKLFKDKLGK